MGSIDFFGAMRARVYDDKVREFVNDIGVEGIGKRLVNSKEGKVVFEKPSIDLETLCSYGDALRGSRTTCRRSSSRTPTLRRLLSARTSPPTEAVAGINSSFSCFLPFLIRCSSYSPTVQGRTTTTEHVQDVFSRLSR